MPSVHWMENPSVGFGVGSREGHEGSSLCVIFHASFDVRFRTFSQIGFNGTCAPMEITSSLNPRQAAPRAMTVRQALFSPKYRTPTKHLCLQYTRLLAGAWASWRHTDDHKGYPAGQTGRGSCKPRQRGANRTRWCDQGQAICGGKTRKGAPSPSAVTPSA